MLLGAEADNSLEGALADSAPVVAAPVEVAPVKVAPVKLAPVEAAQAVGLGQVVFDRLANQQPGRAKPTPLQNGGVKA